MSMQTQAFKLAGALTIAFGVSAGAQAAQKPIQVGTASWYGEEMAKGKKNGKLRYNKTASGQEFSPNRISAAHKTLPLGSCVLAVVKSTGRKLVVEINDRGPYSKGRIIDFSRKAAEELGFKHKGEAKVALYRVPCP